MEEPRVIRKDNDTEEDFLWRQQETLLHAVKYYGTQKGMLEIKELLEEDKISPDFVHGDETPLCAAIENLCWDGGVANPLIVDMLLEHGANPTQPVVRGWPLEKTYTPVELLERQIEIFTTLNADSAVEVCRGIKVKLEALIAKFTPQKPTPEAADVTTISDATSQATTPAIPAGAVQQENPKEVDL